MMSDNRKKLGYASESIVVDYYKSKGYNIVAQNYTIPGGEIDVIVEDDQNLVFVEVKTINAIDDIDGYVTKKKIGLLDNVVQVYLMKNSTDKDISMDVVFVRGYEIVEIYQNITNN